MRRPGSKLCGKWRRECQTADGVGEKQRGEALANAGLAFELVARTREDCGCGGETLEREARANPGYELGQPGFVPCAAQPACLLDDGRVPHQLIGLVVEIIIELCQRSVRARALEHAPEIARVEHER